MTFRDRYGFLHDKKVIDGNPETSENAPMYDGLDIALRFMNRKLTPDEAWEYVKRTSMLTQFEEIKQVWYTTPVSTKPRFSRDNFGGIFMGLECCERKAKQWKDTDLINHIKLLKKKIPIFHKQLDHPRDFLEVVGFKYKLLRPFCMWLPKIAAVISMYQTHKFHGDRPYGYQYQAKTDGKLIGLGLCIAFNWKWTEWVLNKMLSNRRPYPLPDNAYDLVTRYEEDNEWSWGSWYNISMDYFKDHEHDCVKGVT